MRRLVSLVLLSSALLVGCDKPEIDECRRACWNHNKVMFWAGVDDEVKDKSPEEAARIRAIREVEFQEIQMRVEDPDHLNCITECQQNATREQAACMKAAQTPDALSTCLK